jgi:hypothetical protein
MAINSIEESSWLSNRKIHLHSVLIEIGGFAYNKFKRSTYDELNKLINIIGGISIWLME